MEAAVYATAVLLLALWGALMAWCLRPIRRAQMAQRRASLRRQLDPSGGRLCPECGYNMDGHIRAAVPAHTPDGVRPRERVVATNPLAAAVARPLMRNSRGAALPADRGDEAAPSKAPSEAATTAASSTATPDEGIGAATKPDTRANGGKPDRRSPATELPPCPECGAVPRHEGEYYRPRTPEILAAVATAVLVPAALGLVVFAGEVSEVLSTYFGGP